MRICAGVKRSVTCTLAAEPPDNKNTEGVVHRQKKALDMAKFAGKYASDAALNTCINNDNVTYSIDNECLIATAPLRISIIFFIKCGIVITKEEMNKTMINLCYNLIIMDI